MDNYLKFKNINDMEITIKKLGIEELEDNTSVRFSDDNCKYEYRILKNIEKFEKPKNFSYIFVNPVNLIELYDVFNTKLNTPGGYVGTYLKGTIFLNKVEICDLNSSDTLSFDNCVFASSLTLGNIYKLKNWCRFEECTFNTPLTLSKINFDSKLHFISCIFNDSFSLCECKFTNKTSGDKDINIVHCTFNENVSITKNNFSKYYIERTTFNSIVNIDFLNINNSSAIKYIDKKCN